jgi:hypothetical protein
MMPHYILYQITMPNSQFTDQTLLDIRVDCMMLKQDNAQRRVAAAAACDLYEPSAIVVADDLEEAFDVGNGYGKQDTSQLIPLRKHTSMSVGDVLVDVVANVAYACCSQGWQPIVFKTGAVYVKNTLTVA